MYRKTKEKNVSVFNSDVTKIGNYLYTDVSKYSAKVATKRQSQEIINLLRRCFPKNLRILDVGCGDGIFTLELLKHVHPRKIVGFDVAEKAVERAKKRISKKEMRNISFRRCDIYDVKRRFSKSTFDVGVIRGVLHHVYQPQVAIKQLNFLPAIIVLEPNGYNPILKVIEKVSPYHKAHEERSYFPPTLNSWFARNGYYVASQRFVGIVPYFFPTRAAKVLQFLEPFFESLPFIKLLYTGTNVILYKKGLT